MNEAAIVWFQSEDTTQPKEDPQRVPGAELRPAVVADDFRMALEDLLRKAQMEGQVDVLRESVQTLAQALMELEVEQQVGAGKYERTASRTGHRNGSRERQWDTRVGSVELKVPRVRDGSYFPSLLDPKEASIGGRGARGIRPRSEY